MKYDIYDTTFSCGIPVDTAIDKELVLIKVLSNPKLVVVNTGEKCPPQHPDLAEIYAHITRQLRTKTITTNWTKK